MEITKVAILTLVDVLFVLYMTKKHKLPLPLLIVSTFVYTTSYIVPYFMQLAEVSHGIGLFDEDYAFKAVCFFYSFKFAMNLAYYIKYRNNNIIPPYTTEQSDKFTVKLGYNSLFIMILLAFIIQVISINDIAQILNPVDRFFSDNPIITNSMTVLMLILFTIFYVLYAMSEKKNRILLILAIGMCIFYTVLISSRGVILPFLIMASVQLIVGKKYLLSILNLVCSILFYIAAISGRSELGIGNFISKLSASVFLIGDFFNIFLLSVSGVATLTATLSGLDSGSVDVRPDILLFFMYISPIPSFLLSTRIFEYTSLSPYLGIDPSVLGINADFISESILWMSWYGPACIGAVIGYIFSTVDRASTNRHNLIFTNLFFIASLFFILFSNIAALRASSRFLVYSYLIYLLYNNIRARTNRPRSPLPEG